MRILYFIGSLRSGGKERRLLELLNYLNQKSDYELFVILAYNKIDYPLFHQLGINHLILNKKPDSKDPRLFIKLNRICKEYKPDVIHTWGNMQTFYMIPTSLIRNIPIVSSEITSVRPNLKKFSFLGISTKINFRFSKVVTSNSKAGLEALNCHEDSKYRVIYNGINMDRFSNLSPQHKIREKYQQQTRYAVVMVATFSNNKDYERYLRVCREVESFRKDITFFAVGSGPRLAEMRKLAESYKLSNIRFTGQISDVEELVSICDIGILLSNTQVHGEGISNSILEYMALGKPVIASDSGGTKEIVKHNENGYLLTTETDTEVANMLIKLIDDKNKRDLFGQKNTCVLKEEFTIRKMSKAFENIYQKSVSK